MKSEIEISLCRDYDAISAAIRAENTRIDDLFSLEDFARYIVDRRLFDVSNPIFDIPKMANDDVWQIEEVKKILLRIAYSLQEPTNRKDGESGGNVWTPETASTFKELLALSDRYYLINEGGQTFTVDMKDTDTNGQQVFTKTAFRDFNPCPSKTVTIYANGKGKKIRLSDFWLTSGINKQFNGGIVYVPYSVNEWERDNQHKHREYKKEGIVYLNRFSHLYAEHSRNYAELEAMDKDGRQRKHYESMLTKLIRRLIGFEDDGLTNEELEKKSFEYENYLNFIALKIQYPRILSEVMFFFETDKGAGKGTMTTILKGIFGENITPANFNQGSTFNSHILNTLFVIYDEKEPNRDQIEELKSYTGASDGMVTINEKHKSVRKEKIYCNIILNTNARIINSLEQHDRRIFYVTSQARLTTESRRFFDELYRLIADRYFIAYCFNYFANHDLVLNRVSEDGSMNTVELYQGKMDPLYIRHTNKIALSNKPLYYFLNALYGREKAEEGAESPVLTPDQDDRPIMQTWHPKNLKKDKTSGDDYLPKTELHSAIKSLLMAKVPAGADFLSLFKTYEADYCNGKSDTVLENHLFQDMPFTIKRNYRDYRLNLQRLIFKPKRYSNRNLQGYIIRDRASAFQELEDQINEGADRRYNK